MWVWYIGLMLGIMGAAQVQSPADSAWVRPFGARESDLAEMIRPDVRGGYWIAGRTTTTLEHAAVVVRLDEGGGLLWSRRYSLERPFEARDLLPLNQGCVVAGVVKAPAGGADYAALLRLDDAGEAVWTRIYETAPFGGANAVQAAPEGGYMLAGWAALIDAPATDVLLIKTDAAGELEWYHTYGDRAGEWATDLRAVPDGWAVAVQAVDPNDDSGIIGLLKTDGQGNFISLWRNRAIDLGRVQSLAVLPEDGFLIGWVSGYYGRWGNPVVGLDRLDADGNLLWREHYPGVDWTSPRLMLRIPEYGTLIAAHAFSLGAGPRLLRLWKVDPEGGLQYTYYYDGLGYRHWDRTRYYWQYEIADPFAQGIRDFFHAAWPPPEDSASILPLTPVPERSWRHGMFDSFSNVYQVRFSLATRQAVTIQLFDSAGHRVSTVAAGDYAPGNHKETIDGWALRPGIYFVHFAAGPQSLTRKLAFVH